MTGLELDYSYHAIKNKDQLLTFGLGSHVLKYSINQSKFQPEFSNDPTLTTPSTSKLSTDITSGIYYKNKYFLVSIGAKQLIQPKIKVSNTGDTKLIRHYFFNVSYNGIINKKLRYEPSLFLRSIGKPIPQIDISNEFVYLDTYWLGLGYRMRDAAIAYIGIEIGQYTIGYGYEYSTSLLRKYNSGSHEVFFKFSFCKKNKGNLFTSENIKRESKSIFCPTW